MHRILHTAVVVICVLAFFVAVVFSYEKCMGSENYEPKHSRVSDAGPCHE